MNLFVYLVEAFMFFLATSIFMAHINEAFNVTYRRTLSKNPPSDQYKSLNETLNTEILDTEILGLEVESEKCKNIHTGNNSKDPDLNVDQSAQDLSKTEEENKAQSKDTSKKDSNDFIETKISESEKVETQNDGDANVLKSKHDVELGSYSIWSILLLPFDLLYYIVMLLSPIPQMLGVYSVIVMFYLGARRLRLVD